MANTNLQIFQDKPLTFSVSLTEENDRLDCSWFNPVTENKIDNLRKKQRKDRKLVKLMDVININGGKRLPKGTVIVESEANNIPYVRATDIKNQKVNIDTAIRISREIYQEVKNYQLKKDDTVITIVGTIGEVGILDEDIEVCNFTENVARLRVNKDSVLARFILHFLSSEFGRMQTERFTVGSLQYKLSLTNCRNIEIYIPYKENDFDKEIQQEILDEVYELFKQAEKLKKERESLINQANSVVVNTLKIPLPDEKNRCFPCQLPPEPAERLDALFNNPFREDLINNLKQYPYRELGKLIKPQYRENIRPTDFYKLVELEHIDAETGRIIASREVSELGSKKILITANSILVAKLQPEKGKIVIVPREYDGNVGSSELVPILLESSDISLEYLWAVLRSDYVLKQWAYELTGSSRMRIGSTELKQTIIPIPDKKIQEEIVAEIKSLVEESDRLLQKSLELFEEAKHTFINAVTN